MRADDRVVLSRDDVAEVGRRRRRRGSTAARSCPAQNARPAPVSSTARTAGVVRRAAQRVGELRPPSRALKLFSTSGRLSVIVSTPSAARPGCAGGHGAIGTRTCRRIARAVAPVPDVPAPDFSAPDARPPPHRQAAMTHAAPPRLAYAVPPAVDPRFDWRRIAYNVLVSRALDDLEETTNRNRDQRARASTSCSTSSRRADTTSASAILGSLIDHRHDAAGAYYRSRPLLLALGLSDRGRARQPARPRRRLQRRPRHRRRLQPARLERADACCRCPATSARSTRRPPAGRRSIDVSPRRARRRPSGTARSASCSAARRRSRRTASGRRSRWRRRSSCRCSSTSKTTGSASR